MFFTYCKHGIRVWFFSMKALKLTIAIIAGKSMAYNYIVLYFYNKQKSSLELVFSSFVHNSQKN